MRSSSLAGSSLPLIDRTTASLKPGSSLAITLNELQGKLGLPFQVLTAEFGPFEVLVMELGANSVAEIDQERASWGKTAEVRELLDQWSAGLASGSLRELWQVVK